MTHTPDFTFELSARTDGFHQIAGVDEVGRGPIAGPVVAAAVILDPDNIPDGLNDSKRLTARKREILFDLIPRVAQVGIAEATVAEIDTHNILRASHIAMVRAIASLPQAPDFALIDGNLLPRDMPCPATTIIKGDSRSLSIAAASIMAKVWRDRLMVGLAQQHPGYGWDRNAGYPTPEHKEGLKCNGVTLHHRRSFAPVRNILWQEKNP
ncbi:ribonuclease HII [Loktanella sp. 3ANDIMAR09]|uniref:ribonuclease HII n=1 Tax=Loktanella sp. 3ANDIMAR09 TaxID=1225657 RepID=UPI0007016A55|nr:ribonuclease HII [Loktanella sp. 3ANDIMAR09]KQI70208.1 ribonuclease HII [Loktanella sp. 3ANDIMAR09]